MSVNTVHSRYMNIIKIIDRCCCSFPVSMHKAIPYPFTVYYKSICLWLRRILSRHRKIMSTCIVCIFISINTFIILTIVIGIHIYLTANITVTIIACRHILIRHKLLNLNFWLFPLHFHFTIHRTRRAKASMSEGVVKASDILGRDLGIAASQTRRYAREADALARAIGRYFGAEMCGYETYRYYDGNTKLRSWICMPLIVGLYDRAEGTVAALLGPELRTEDGLLTEQGSTTFWDRATLYALRGVFQAGYTEEALQWLQHYSARRLLGDHVPYPIEAWPEGSQRHLSAESGLYCRIVTEGLFGIRPTGFRSFDLTPRLPAAWPEMSLRRVQAFGTTFDIEVERLDDGRLSVTVDYDGHRIERVIASGKSLSVRLS